jgi:hypothetical protein
MVRFASVRRVIVLLVAVALCAGCGSGGSSKISPAAYVGTVCSAISPLQRDVVSRTQGLNNSASTNAAQAKKSLQRFLAAIELDSSQVVSKIRAAGTPDIANGPAVAATIVKAFTQLRDAMHSAAAKASALPTDSPTSYKTAFQALNVSVRASLNNIDPSGFSNPDIEKAAAKEPACKSLNR